MVAAETGLPQRTGGRASRTLYTSRGAARTVLGCGRVTIIPAEVRTIAFPAHTGRKQAKSRAPAVAGPPTGWLLVAL